MMPGRAELHFHLLPGVDDGPVDVDESLELAELAVRDGTSLVVATPHARFIDIHEVDERVADLQSRIRERGIPLEVRPGVELAYYDVTALDAAELDLVAQGPTGARWVLLEAPLPDTGATAGEFTDAADTLRAHGFSVLVGHPERSPVVLADGARALRREIAAGSRLQLNATSLTGAHGDDARRAAIWLARAGLASIVASDAHRPTRGPALTRALELLLRAGVARRLARRMTDDLPRLLLDRGLRDPAMAGRARVLRTSAF